MEVMLFAGCVIDQYFPETAFNAVKILERVGCTVRVPGNSGCCGWPAWQNAQEEISRDIAGRCLAELSPERPVVTLSSDCSAMMHSYIPQLLHNGSAHHSAVSLHKRVHTFSQWVVLQAGGPLCPPRSGMTRLACHVSCCVQNDDIPQALPRLMGELGGFSCIEVPGFSVCCGYGSCKCGPLPPGSRSWTGNPTGLCMQPIYWQRDGRKGQRKQRSPVFSGTGIAHPGGSRFSENRLYARGCRAGRRCAVAG